ncbi:MAG: NBR1-Ig-like domain-containing protein [Anaerolineales bacterium]
MYPVKTSNLLSIVLAWLALAACSFLGAATPVPTIPFPTPVVPSVTSPPATAAPPTDTPVVATPGPACLNRAEFVRDVTIRDNSRVGRGESFVKTWRLRNSGTCTWDERYLVAHIGGPLMSAPTSLPLAGPVRPGQEMDLSVPFLAPVGDGTYRSDWMILGPAGAFFGVGEEGDLPFYVQIVVGSGVPPSRTPTPTSIYQG